MTHGLRSILSGKQKRAPSRCRKGRFLKAEGEWEKKIIGKECIVLGRVALQRGMEGSISRFPSAVREIPCWLVQVYIPGGIETAVGMEP